MSGSTCAWTSLARGEASQESDVRQRRGEGRRRPLTPSFGPFIGPFIGPYVHSLVRTSIHRSILWSTRPFIGPFFGPYVHSSVHSLVHTSIHRSTRTQRRLWAARRPSLDAVSEAPLATNVRRCASSRGYYYLERLFNYLNE